MSRPPSIPFLGRAVVASCTKCEWNLYANARTHARTNESICRLRARAFLPLSLPSHASSVARRVMPSRRRRDRHSIRVGSKEVPTKTERASSSAEVPRRRFRWVFYPPESSRVGARGRAFFASLVGGRSVWVYVFSVCAGSTRTNGARGKDGWMDGWCERKGLIRKVTTTDACGMNLYSSVM